MMRFKYFLVGAFAVSAVSAIAAYFPSGSLSDPGTDGITITNGTGAVVGIGTSLSQAAATGSQNGYLKSTDWTTFNNKQTSGSYVTAGTGDVTFSGPGSAATTIAKIAGVAVGTPSGTGNVVMSNNATLVAPALGTPASGVATNLTGTASGLTAGNVNATSNSTITSLSSLASIPSACTLGGGSGVSGTGAEIFNVNSTSSSGQAAVDFAIGSAGANGEAVVDYFPGHYFAIGTTANDTTTPLEFWTNNGTTQLTITPSGAAIFAGPMMINTSATIGTGLEGITNGPQWTALTASSYGIDSVATLTSSSANSHTIVGGTLNIQRTTSGSVTDTGNLDSNIGRVNISVPTSFTYTNTGSTIAALVASPLNLTGGGSLVLDYQGLNIQSDATATTGYKNGIQFNSWSGGTNNALIADNKSYSGNYAINLSSTNPSVLGGNLSIGSADPFSRSYAKSISVSSSGNTGLEVNGAAGGNGEVDVGINGTRVADFTAVFGTPVVAQVVTNGAYALNFGTNNLTALTLDTIQNATFTGSGVFGGNITTNGDQIFIAPASGSAAFNLKPASGSAGQIANQTTGAAIQFFTSSLSVSDTEPLQIAAAGTIKIPNIGTSTAALDYLCWNASTGAITGDGSGTCLASTIKVKENIKDLDIGLKEVMALHPISFDYKKSYSPRNLGNQIGFVAEEAVKVDKRLATRDPKGELNGVKYAQMAALLTKAIQEQQEEIILLKTQIKSIQRRVR